MIVTKPAWTRRRKAYHTVWWHEWHGQPYTEDPRIRTGRIASAEWRDGEYRAQVYSHGVSVEIGTFDTLEAAQTACDAHCAEQLGVSLDEAMRNWKSWTKERRKAARKAREEQAAESEARMTPKARERSRQLAEALGGRRTR